MSRHLPPLPSKRIFFFRTQNVVSSASLGTSIDTRDACEVLSARLGFSIFPATHSISRQSGDVSISIFDSGQLVISGSRSTSQALMTVYLAVAALNERLHRTDLRVFNFKRQNIVLSCELGFSLNVDLFASDDDVNVKYTPELFDGAHWRSCNLGRKCLGFPEKKDRHRHDRPVCPGLHIGFVLFPGGKVLTTMIKSFSSKWIAEERLKKVLRYQFGNEYRELPESRECNRFRMQKKRKLNSGAIAKLPRLQDECIEQRRLDVERQKKQREENEWKMAERILPFKPLFIQEMKPATVRLKAIFENLNLSGQLLWTGREEDPSDPMDIDSIAPHTSCHLRSPSIRSGHSPHASTDSLTRACQTLSSFSIS